MSKGSATTSVNLRQLAGLLDVVAISTIPVGKANGKKPLGGTWTPRQQSRPTPEQLDEEYADRNATGVAAVCGAVSGNLELIEFEAEAVDRGLYVAFLDEIGRLDPELGETITSGWVQQSPSGGVHLIARCAEPPNGSTKLAQRPRTVDEAAAWRAEKPRRDKKRVPPIDLIETRGEGGYFIVGGSARPDHGSAPEVRHPKWESIVGGPANVPTITAEQRDLLHAVARGLDEKPSEPAETSKRERSGGRITQGANVPEIAHFNPGQQRYLEDVVRALERAGCEPHVDRRRGQGEARCPCHADDSPSLSFAVGDVGLMARCYAKSCGVNHVQVAEALGISRFINDYSKSSTEQRATHKPSFPPRAQPEPSSPPGCRLEAYRAAKTPFLTLAQLRSVGVKPGTREERPAVVFDWMGLQLDRRAIDGDWRMPRVNDNMRELGLDGDTILTHNVGWERFVVMVEGVTDTITSLAINWPTIGLRSANSLNEPKARRRLREVIDGLTDTRVIVAQHNDKDGELLTDNINLTLDGTGTEIIVVPMPGDEHADLADLFAAEGSIHGGIRRFQSLIQDQLSYLQDPPPRTYTPTVVGKEEAALPHMDSFNPPALNLGVLTEGPSSQQFLETRTPPCRNREGTTGRYRNRCRNTTTCVTCRRWEAKAHFWRFVKVAEGRSVGRIETPQTPGQWARTHRENKAGAGQVPPYFAIPLDEGVTVIYVMAMPFPDAVPVRYTDTFGLDLQAHYRARLQGVFGDLRISTSRGDGFMSLRDAQREIVRIEAGAQ